LKELTAVQAATKNKMALEQGARFAKESQGFFIRHAKDSNTKQGQETTILTPQPELTDGRHADVAQTSKSAVSGISPAHL